MIKRELSSGPSERESASEMGAREAIQVVVGVQGEMLWWKGESAPPSTLNRLHSPSEPRANRFQPDE